MGMNGHSPAVVAAGYVRSVGVIVLLTSLAALTGMDARHSDTHQHRVGVAENGSADGGDCTVPC